MNQRWLRRLWPSLCLACLMLAGNGCARLVARSLVKAPNSYPDWLSPAAHTFVALPAGFRTNFLLQTFPVTTPAARLAYRVVEPADYALTVTNTVRWVSGRQRTTFRFGAALPAPANAFTTQPRGTVFLVHGYGGDMGYFVPLALLLAQDGWRCVLVDLRGHGDSTGGRISFGLVEARDLSELLTHLQAQNSNAPVAVIGHSLGASVALRWKIADPRVQRVVAVSPYARLESAGLNLRAQHAAWFPEGLTQSGFQALPDLLHIGPGELDPATFLGRTPQPVLFIVGGQDTITPPLDTSRLLTLSAPGSRSLTVLEARHEDAPFHVDAIHPAIRNWLLATPAPVQGETVR